MTPSKPHYQALKSNELGEHCPHVEPPEFSESAFPSEEGCSLDTCDETSKSVNPPAATSFDKVDLKNPPLVIEDISILTMNCWGIFVKHMTVAKGRRLAALREALKSSTYDIILLQELWENREYEKFKEALSDRYPYTVYFHSQVFGAGICIFFPVEAGVISDLPLQPQRVPHYIHQGDWLSGKSMGYATVLTPKGFRLNLYVTHTHARYHINHKRDVVEGHRLGQAMELMEFVRATAGSADVIFIGGDLNLEPYTTGLNLLKRSLGLKDAWLDQLERQPVTDLNALELEGCTCENKSNPFASKAWTATSGNGLRLDYLLYRPGVQGPSNVSVLCESCRLEMREIPNGDGLHYSDHEGVAGYFRLSRHPETFVDHIPPVGLIQTLDDLLRDALTILNRQISRAKRFRALHFTLAAVLLLLVLFFGTYWPFTHPALAFLQTLVVLLSGAIIFSLMWGNLVGRQCELNALRNMVNLVEHYSELSLVTKTP